MFRQYNIKLFIPSIILLLGILSCNQKSAQIVQPDTWDKQNIRNIDISDTAYLHAIRIAQENIDIFEKLLKDKKKNNLQFFIKSKFTQGKHVEHIWLLTDSIDNNLFSATLDNIPNNLTTVKFGDKVKVARHDVEDWIIYEGDSVLFGNFISNAFRK